ncbi:hypothetical protein BDA96_02G202100 [Sorghum bicolor]|uniref:KIB1-4 beta-propeller domain-containing protein n=2 Tax=Sorghum bicolor TaxID=4558 RepID=A0A921RNE8_SORBI|nr:hypothetical protein BDA96_02G202100 [Sorghum bicolor]KXG35558.1 hypothetical protein SORBI_3002G191200 [Sorghum bicolor]
MYGVNNAFPISQIARAIQAAADSGGGWYPWKFSEFRLDKPMLDASPLTNLVRHRGLLYMLGVDGRLAVYDDNRHEEGLRLLDKPQGFGGFDDDFDDDFFSYLFEFDEGELMAVLMGCCRRTPVHVLRLNEQEMQWEKQVDGDLKGRALFTGTPATIMVETDVKWMRNKIFVPRLYDWPETLHVDLVERGAASSVAQCTTGSSGTAGMWTCGLGHQESSEFWETIKLDYSIWVDFRN